MKLFSFFRKEPTPELQFIASPELFELAINRRAKLFNCSEIQSQQNYLTSEPFYRVERSANANYYEN